MKKIFSNGSTAIIAQIVALIYGFVLPRLIISQYGSEVYGLTQSIGYFLGIISFLDMGVGQVVRWSLYGPLAQNDHKKISAIMVSGRKYYRTIAYVLLGYIVALLFVYPLLVKNDYGWMYTASLIGVIALSSFAQYYFGIINEQLLHADQKSYIIYSVQILSNLVNLIVCVWMIRLEMSIHALKLMTSLIFVIKPLIYGFYVQRYYKIDKAITFTESPIKNKWHGVAQHVSAVVLDGTDNIVLTLFSTLSNVSIYSVYFMIITNLSGLYQSAITGIQSAAGALWVKQDQKAIREFFSVTESGLHAISIFLFCCAYILIVPFVQVYTDGFTDANYIQPLFAGILVLAYGIRCLRTPYNVWILAAGHFRQTQKCHITAAIINLVFSVFAVTRWGLVGTAIGTLVAMCYQTTWMVIYTVRNLVKCSFSHILKLCISDIFAIAAICLTASGITLHEVSYMGWFLMAVKVSLIAILCISCSFLLFNRKTATHLINRFLRKST